MNKENAGDVLVKSAQTYILEHYTDKFSMDTIADALHVNKSYLARVFKKRTGSTLLQFHNGTRCEAAKELLSRPELSISYIASETGFVSASHFSRIFREYTGFTPTEYRYRRSF